MSAVPNWHDNARLRETMEEVQKTPNSSINTGYILLVGQSDSELIRTCDWSGRQGAREGQVEQSKL